MKIYFHFSLEGFSNSYLIGNEKTGKALIVDPGVMTTEILTHIGKNNYDLEAILITHNHPSHHMGLKTLLKIFSPKVYAADAALNGRQTTMIQGDGSLMTAGFIVKYFAVPGHSPDSVMFQIDNFIFTGDALSAGKIGDTSNIYGKRNLLTNLKNKLLSLPNDYILFPGHGPPSTIGAERSFNQELIQGLNKLNKSIEEPFGHL